MNSNPQAYADADATRTPSIAENEPFTLPEVPAAANPKKAPVRKSTKMSAVSKMYDIDGDGELNDAEQAMRNMDQSGKGYLTNDKVYKLMVQQLETQKQLFQTRRIMFVLLGLVVLLALSNLGTSLAAAHLAKDTAANEDDQLTHKDTGVTLGTQSTTDGIEIQRTVNAGEDGRRELCTRSKGDVVCDADSFLSVDWKTCRRLLRHCRRGNTVSLSRTWSNGDTSQYEVCPHTGTVSRYHRSTLANDAGDEFYIEQTPGESCEMGGDAISQAEGEVCEVDDDCRGGMACVEDKAFIETCKLRCDRKRWAKRLADECKVDCENPSCQLLGEDA